MENMNLLQNKMELKELVDVFSILADKKDTKAQAELFTEDATLKSYIDNQLASEQHGMVVLPNIVQSTNLKYIN